MGTGEACAAPADVPFGAAPTWMVVEGELPEALLLYGAWPMSYHARSAEGWYTLWAELDGEHLFADTRWVQGVGVVEVTLDATLREGWMEGTATLLEVAPETGDPTCGKVQPFRADRVRAAAPAPVAF